MKKIIAFLCAAAMAMTAVPASAAGIETETETVSVEYAAKEEPKMTALEQALSDYFYNGGKAPSRSKLEKITSLEVYGTVVLVNRTVEDYFGVDESSGVVIAFSDYDNDGFVDETVSEPYFFLYLFENGEERHYPYPVAENTIKTKLISKMTNLKHLRIQDAKLKKIGFAEELTKLRELLLCGSFKDISAVKGLKKLTYLYLNGNFTDISAVKGLKKLTTLELYGNFEDISVIRKLKRLETLALGWSAGDVSALKDLNGLKTLVLDSDKEIEGLQALRYALPNTSIAVLD